MVPELIRGVLWSFFQEYMENIELSEKRDENNKWDDLESINYLLNAEKIKENIEKLWGLNQDLLAGVFMYLDRKDDYFNPRLNTETLFFDKIFVFNKSKLEKIGRRTLKPIFPFVSYENYDKNIVLLR